MTKLKKYSSVSKCASADKIDVILPASFITYHDIQIFDMVFQLKRGIGAFIIWQDHV